METHTHASVCTHSYTQTHAGGHTPFVSCRRISNSNEEQEIKGLRCLGCYTTRRALPGGPEVKKRNTDEGS